MEHTSEYKKEQEKEITMPMTTTKETATEKCIENVENIEETENIESVENMERTESRSAYQKRKRAEQKQQKRRHRKLMFLIISVVVILAGVLCGTVLADSMHIPHNTVEIASANAQQIKHTVTHMAGNVAEKLSWDSFQDFLQDSFEEARQNKEDNKELNKESKETANANDEEVTSQDESKRDTENEMEMQNGVVQTTTESAIAVTELENPYGIDPSKPMVALTFDDGPSKHTWTIVSALQQHNARATFFLVGNRVTSYQAAIDFILSNHNEVASHGFSHANLEKCTEEEVLAQIQSTDAALQEQHAYTPTLFRVPYGARNEQVLQILKEQGKPVIGWSVDPRDWDVQDKDKIVKHVLSHVKDGDIVLMHDLYKPTADAVVELIPELQKRGYQLVTVSELFQYKGIALTPGTYYYATWK